MKASKLGGVSLPECLEETFDIKSFDFESLIKHIDIQYEIYYFKEHFVREHNPKLRWQRISAIYANNRTGKKYWHVNSFNHDVVLCSWLHKQIASFFLPSRGRVPKNARFINDIVGILVDMAMIKPWSLSVDDYVLLWRVTEQWKVWDW